MNKPKLDANNKVKLKKLIKELDRVRARHTELITVYIPDGYPISKKVQQLSDEQGTATNIKSSATRKNVINGIEKMIQALKNYSQTPTNGLAIFAGNVSEKEGSEDYRVYEYVPPFSMNQNLYRCDKVFITEPLHAYVDDDEVYGLVVLDRRDATIATLKGSAIHVLKKTHSEIPGKMKAGGQSAMRFHRLRVDAIDQHFKKIANFMKDEFLFMENLKGILVGGPGITINDFVTKGYLTGDLQKRVIGTADLSYTDEWGLKELVEKSQDLLANEQIVEQKRAVDELLGMLRDSFEKVAYGINDVKSALEMGAVDTLLLMEDLDENLSEELETLCLNFKGNVKYITPGTEHGSQLESLGKVIAKLRYPI